MFRHSWGWSLQPTPCNPTRSIGMRFLAFQRQRRAAILAWGNAPCTRPSRDSRAEGLIHPSLPGLYLPPCLNRFPSSSSTSSSAPKTAHSSLMPQAAPPSTLTYPNTSSDSSARSSPSPSKPGRSSPPLPQLAHLSYQTGCPLHDRFHRHEWSPRLQLPCQAPQPLKTAPTY